MMKVVQLLSRRSQLFMADYLYLVARIVNFMIHVDIIILLMVVMLLMKMEQKQTNSVETKTGNGWMILRVMLLGVMWSTFIKRVIVMVMLQLRRCLSELLHSAIALKAQGIIVEIISKLLQKNPPEGGFFGVDF